MPPRAAARWTAALALAVAAASAAAYLRALGVGFFSDDYEWLARMPPAIENPLWVFRVFYRDFNPVLHLSFLADFVAGGGSAVAFHATSIAVHATAAALLVLLGRRFTDRPALAAAAAATWALNPRISEAVIWPAARGHSLATLLVLAAALALGSASAARRWAAVPLFALALLTKETALLPLLLAAAFVPDVRRNRALLATVYATGAAFVGLNALIKPELHLSPDSAWFLLRKAPFLVLRPLGLGDAYDFGAASFAVAVSILGIVAATLLRTPARAGVLWVALCLVPVVPLDKVSSRYFYMPAIGFALVLCAIAEPLASRLRAGAVRRAAVAAAGVLLALVLVTDVLRIRQEIEDYRILGEPFARCLEALAPAAAALRPGDELVLIDRSPRSAPADLQRRIFERGTMNKLIPARADAVGGLIGLADAIAILRADERGMLASRAEGPVRGARRVFVYDGDAARPVDEPAGAGAVDDGPRFAARWDTAGRFFAGD